MNTFLCLAILRNLSVPRNIACNQRAFHVAKDDYRNQTQFAAASSCILSNARTNNGWQVGNLRGDRYQRRYSDYPLFSTTSAVRGWIRYNDPRYNRSSTNRSPAHLGRCWKVQRAEGKARTDVTIRNEVKLMLELPWGRHRYQRVQLGAGYKMRSWKDSERNPRERARGRDFSPRGEREDPRLHHEQSRDGSRALPAILCLARFMLDRRFSPSLYLDISRLWIS